MTRRYAVGQTVVLPSSTVCPHAYDPNTMDWWLAARTAEGLRWTQIDNTAGFGQVGDSRPFWTGDLTGVGRSQTLFYYPGDQNWWVGTVNRTSLSWALWGNTSGFGNTVHDPTWTGNFTGQGRTEVLFYSPGDYNSSGRSPDRASANHQCLDHVACPQTHALARRRTDTGGIPAAGEDLRKS